jgi:transposase-like protein
VDETYTRVKGKWAYLYRAVDSSGAGIDFPLSAQCDAAAAKRFFQKGVAFPNHPTSTWTRILPIRPWWKLKGEGTLRCRLRPMKYLNNLSEQDHRAIKRRVKASQGFR